MIFDSKFSPPETPLCTSAPLSCCDVPGSREVSPSLEGAERKISAPAGYNNFSYATPSYLQLQSNNKRRSVNIELTNNI